MTFQNERLGYFLQIKALMIAVSNIIGIFFVFGASLYYEEICMSTFSLCQVGQSPTIQKKEKKSKISFFFFQSFFSETIPIEFHNETSILVFRWNKITIYGIFYAGFILFISAISFTFLTFLVIIQTKDLTRYVSQTTIEMQHYFLIIFLLQVLFFIKFFFQIF